MAEKHPTHLLESSPELLFTQDELHAALVIFQPDHLQYDPSVERPEVAIVDDTFIRIDSQNVKLSRSQRFVFNVLRINQGDALSSSDIKNVGYELTDRSFFNALNGLVASISTVACDPIIEVSQADTGQRKNLYTLLPEVNIIDERQQGKATKQLNARKYMQLDDDGLPAVDKEGIIAFHGPTARKRATFDMIRELKDQSTLERWPHLFFKELGARAITKTILPVTTELELDKDRETALLEQKEQALHLYFQKDTFNEEETAKLLEGVDAFHVLFARNLDLAAIYAGKYTSAGDPQSYDELYQRCAESLLGTVASSRPEYSLEELSVRPLAAFEMHRSLRPSERVHELSYASIKPERLRQYMAAQQKVAESGEVTIDKIAQEMNASPALVAALQSAIGKTSLDELVYTPASIIDDGFVEAELDRIERENVLADLMAGNDLIHIEKIILSLAYGLYSPALCGVELPGKTVEVQFEYPRTIEEFTELSKSISTQNEIAELLGRTYPSVRDLHSRALRKARLLLQDDPIFDTYGRISAEQIASEAAEREQIVQQALAVSPGTALTEETIQALPEGAFATLSRVEYLFGSVGGFQEACGFQPNKRAMTRMLTNQEIIASCRQQNPENKPVRGQLLYELQAEGIAPSRPSIERRFGSLAEFNRQCGFE